LDRDQPNDVRRPAVSILVPTLNEAGNIDPLITRILSTIEKDGLEAEVLIVDGGSTDGTCERVGKWTSRSLVRFIQSDARLGLAGDIVEAAKSARGEIAVVLDADLSHPPESIPQIVRPVLNGTHDMTIGSRYVHGGSMVEWPWIRWFISRVATMLIAPLVSVKDPLSGFFAVRRELLLKVASDAVGFKIALEVLARGDDALRVMEVPIVFQKRIYGRSKLGIRQVGIFLMQLLSLSGGMVPGGHGLRFAAVGLLGLVIDFLMFHALLAARVEPNWSQLTSFFTATVFVYALNVRGTDAQSAQSGSGFSWGLHGRFLTVCLLALLVRCGFLMLLMESWHWQPQTAILVAMPLAAAVFLVGAVLFVFRGSGSSDTPLIRWRVVAVVVVIYTVLLRLAFMGPINLTPEEAYYWSYAQYLDLSYLDHPAMVAWLIWIFTSLLGKSELSVRLPALMCWAIAAGFMYRFAFNLFEKNTAFRSVLLMAVLPIYFAFGFFMTPDAPLLAAWSACLYFLERALIGQRRKAWWGVGICVGLGMLSKYTMAFVGVSTLVYLLTDRRSRQWWLRKEPYLAGLIALMLFLPVLIWNAEHGWASFFFQGPGRWSGRPHFSVHWLVVAILLLLTPVGAAAVLKVFLPGFQAGPAGFKNLCYGSQERLFAFVFTAVPLSVFVVYSLVHAPRLNWTGSLWLAVIPLIAWDMVPQGQEVSKRLTPFLYRISLPLIGFLLVLLSSSFYYISLGLPGTDPASSKGIFGPWRYLGEKVEAIERNVEARTGAKPLIVGMDRYFISSELAFYDFLDNDGILNAGGPHLFGGRSRMWAYWFPRQAQEGRNIIMVHFDRESLMRPALSRYFERISDVVTETIEKDGRVLGYFYWRVGYSYRG
jgi:dolichol-phosphate mannosyltransferase